MRLILTASLLLLAGCQQNLFNQPKYTGFHRAHFRGFHNPESPKAHKRLVGKEEIKEGEEIRADDSPELYYAGDSLSMEDAAPQELKEETAAFTPSPGKSGYYKEIEHIVPEAEPVDTVIVMEDAKTFRNVGLGCAFTGYAGVTAAFSTFVLGEFMVDGALLLGIAGISLLLIILGMSFLWTSIVKMRSVGKNSPRGIKFLAVFSTVFVGVAVSIGLMALAIVLLFAL